MRFDLQSVSAALIVLMTPGLRSAIAQSPEDDRRAMRERILKQVERILDEHEKQVREEVRRLLDREIGGGKEARPDDRAREPERRERPAAAPARPAAYLGVKVVETPEATRKLLGLKEGEGLLVEEVVKDSPAEKAGVRKEDILLAINGDKVGDPEMVVDDIRGRKAGDTLELSILREGEKKSVKAVLAARPAERAAGPEREKAAPPRRPEGEGGFRDRVRRYLEERDRDPEEKTGDEPAPPDERDEDQGRGREGRGLPEIEEAERFLNSPDGKGLVDELKAMGIDPGMFLQKGEDGAMRLSDDVLQLMKGVTEDDLKMLKDLMGDLERPSGRRRAPRREEEESDPKPGDEGNETGEDR